MAVQEKLKTEIPVSPGRNDVETRRPELQEGRRRMHSERRSVEMQIISDWVEPGSRILDIGCGRGVLLAELKREKSIFGVGVDSDPEKILSCLGRDVNAYHGDLKNLLPTFPDKFFDRAICSRTLQELDQPAKVIFEALRVSRFLTVGFVNYGYWKNRLSLIRSGRRIENEVYPKPWYNSRSAHSISVAEFERFCAMEGIRIVRKVYLKGDWATRGKFLPNLLCGYVLYDLQKKE